YGHRTELHGVARLHVGLDAGDDDITRCETLRSEDVALFAVFVLQQCEERGAIRIVLETLDGRRHVVLGAAEVDDTIRLLVTATDVTRRDAAVVVATAGLVLTLGQRL